MSICVKRAQYKALKDHSNVVKVFKSVNYGYLGSSLLNVSVAISYLFKN